MFYVRFIASLFGAFFLVGVKAYRGTKEYKLKKKKAPKITRKMGLYIGVPCEKLFVQRLFVGDS